MSIVNEAIPSFIGGVTQQPPSIRHTSQLDAMVNCVPSPASGTRKRSGTQHFRRLSTADHNGAFVHAINRGTEGVGERYFVVINAGDLKVYNWYGDQVPVDFPDGKQYLAVNFARGNFAACTVEDYTFITNKLLPVKKMPWFGTDPAQKVWAQIRVAVAKTAYAVQLNGTAYTYTTGDATTATVNTLSIVTGLAAAINAGTQFDALVVNNLIECSPRAGSGITNFTFDYTDGYGNQAGNIFSTKVNRYEELPRQFVENHVIEIKGEPGISTASWYARWVRTAGATGDGTWVETLPYTAARALDASTMPWQLVRETTGRFTFKKVTWDERLVGDDLSCPFPSFVGSPINGVFFHRNRLGFLADENLVMSSTGKYFNFFNGSARADVDSDPIDVSSSSTKVTILRDVVAFDKALLVFSDKQQFQFSSGETLTGRTAKLDPTTAFECAAYCSPAPLGRNIFFATNRGQYAAIREYYFDGNTVNNDADDVTSHVPSYIPAGVFKIATSPTEDMVFALTSADRHVIYVYNSKWNGDQRVQSAWHKWEFDISDTILNVDCFGSTLSIITQRADGVYLDMMELEERPFSPASYTMCVDRWVGYYPNSAQCVYNAGTDTTVWTLPYNTPPDGDVRVILCNEDGARGKGTRVPNYGGPQVSLKGNHTGVISVVGIEYDGWMRLSQLYARDPKDQSLITTRTQLRNIIVEFDRTGYFEAWVTPLSRETQRYVMSGNHLGLSSLTVGIEQIESGSFRIPLMAKSDEVTIELHNISHLPSAWLSAEWQGHIAMQARRQ